MAAKLIAWTKELETGIQPIDEQHRALVEQANSVYAVLVSGARGDKLGKELRTLMSLTAGHFAFEEELMQRSRYPDFESHRLAHELLLSRGKQLLIGFEEGTVQPLQMAKLVSKWVVDHIVDRDMGYVPYVKMAA